MIRLLRVRRGFLRRLPAAFVVAGLCGCAAETRPPRPPAPPAAIVQPAQSPVGIESPELRDVEVLPQRLEAYFSAEEMDRPLLSAEVQARTAARLRRLQFAPWHRTKPGHSRADALWGLRLLNGRHYGENLRRLGPDFAARMRRLVQAESYPNTLRRAIATSNTSLRLLPTVRPGFLKPNRPGEGYPFDYFQNSGVLAGTPLLVTQRSADGAWALVEARTAGGWVPVSDIAFVDDAFVNAWEALPFAAIVREGAPVVARFAASGGDPGIENGEGDSATLFTGRIGMLLPLSDADSGGVTVLAPGREADGRAVSLAVRLSREEAAPVPLPFTPRNFARLGDQLMGQPYGWGGYLGNRDCSALLLDLYAPFGIFLPRNSRQQSRSGRWEPFEGLPPTEKETRILAAGRPLLTLLHKRGHIMLYVGERDGHAVILHDLWGLHTKSADGVKGRFLVGGVSLTTVSPGAEVPDVARAGVLLETLDGMTQIGIE